LIDEGLTEPWPQEVIDAARHFQQGDLIEHPPIAYAASLDHPIWSLTRLEAGSGDDQSETEYLGLDDEDRPPYGIITSQTCDVFEDRPQPLQPWFDVAPVYACPEDSPLLKRDFIYPLDGFPAPQGDIWVVDLRLSASLEKGVLVGRKPTSPFGGDEQARIDFGVALGRRLARAALAGTIHAVIERTIDKHKRNTGRRVGKRVYKLLLDIAEGTRLKPRTVRLHAVCRDPFEGSITNDEMQDWFDTWYDEAREVAEQEDINLLAPVLHRAASMDVVMYDHLVEIRCPLHKTRL
jgi:hypothetical protein